MRKGIKGLKRVAELSGAGLENICKEDLIIPRLALVQPGSKAAKPGTYYSYLTSECYENPLVRFLIFSRGRVMFSSDEGAGANDANDVRILCRSSDARVPDARILNSPADYCDACLNSVPIGGMEPPCRLTYNFLAVVRRNRRSVRRKGANLYWISFKGKGTRECRKFLSAVFLKALREGINLFDLEVRLASRLVRGKEVDYFIPTFDIVRSSKIKVAALRYLLYKNESADKAFDARIARAGLRARHNSSKVSARA